MKAAHPFDHSILGLPFQTSYDIDSDLVQTEENSDEDFVLAKKVDQYHGKQKSNVVIEKESTELRCGQICAIQEGPTPMRIFYLDLQGQNVRGRCLGHGNRG